MVKREGQEGDRPCYSMKPPTPRATSTSSTNGKETTSNIEGQQQAQANDPTTCNQQEKKQFSRMFFPDSSKGTVGFFRKRRVQNIDWKLAEAVQCVENLRLDGDTSGATPRQVGGSYEPPSAFGH